MAKEIVLRFNAINKRRGGIGYFGPTKETLKSLPRSGLVLLTEIVTFLNYLKVYICRWSPQSLFRGFLPEIVIPEIYPSIQAFKG